MLAHRLFRRMKSDDVPVLIRISRENMAPVILSSWGVRWRDETVFDMLMDPESMTEVLVVDGVIAGYFTVERRDCSIFINSIQVSKGMKRGGHGKKMMQRIETYALMSGLDSVDLWVQTTNTEAFGFYGKMGYSSICENGNNVLMRKSLRPKRSNDRA